MSLRMVTITVSEMSVGVLREALINEGKRVHGNRLGKPSERAVHMAEIQICLDALDNVEVHNAPKSSAEEICACSNPPFTHKREFHHRSPFVGATSSDSSRSPSAMGDKQTQNTDGS